MSLTPPRPSTRTLAATVLASAALAVLGTTPANAGTYSMYSCNPPGVNLPNPSAGPWTFHPTANMLASDRCAENGGYSLYFPHSREMSVNTRSFMQIARPAHISQSISLQRVRLWMIARLRGQGSGAYVHMDSGGPSGNGEIAFAPPGADRLTSPYESPHLDESTSGFQAALYCSFDASANCYLDEDRPLEIRGSQVILRESILPEVSATGGTLTTGGPQRGVRSMNYTARDGESGVERVEVLLDDAVVAVDDLARDLRRAQPEQRGACTYTGWNACPKEHTRDVAVDTTRVADATYALRLRVTDAAKNERVVTLGPVTIANGRAGAPSTAPASTGGFPPGTPNGENPSARAEITATFIRSGRSTLTIRYGSRATLRGRLVDDAGRPIRNARVEVLETPTGRGARTIDKGGVRTRPDGTFRYTVARNASSRALRLIYRTRHGDQQPAATRDLALRVRARASLSVSVRAGRVTYRGRVLSGTIPQGGKLVLIQGRSRGSAWQTFATRRARRGGAFSGRYRLRVRYPGTRLEFRVVVPAESGYPYLSGSGSTVTRTVR